MKFDFLSLFPNTNLSRQLTTRSRRDPSSDWTLVGKDLADAMGIEPYTHVMCTTTCPWCGDKYSVTALWTHLDGRSYLMWTSPTNTTPHDCPGPKDFSEPTTDA